MRETRRYAGFAVIAVVTLAGFASSLSFAHTRWRDCGWAHQGDSNGSGYNADNRVQVRDRVSCATGLEIGSYFESGGYNYHGLTCFYAAMGSGNPYWNWNCGAGTPGRRINTPSVVQGHVAVTKRQAPSSRCGRVWVEADSVYAKARVVVGSASCHGARVVVRDAFTAFARRRHDSYSDTWGLTWNVHGWACSHGEAGSQAICFRQSSEIDGSVRSDDGWNF